MASEPSNADAQRNLADIQTVTDAALARMETAELLNELLDRVRVILDVDTAAVLLMNSLGERLVAVAARGLEEEVRQGVQIPVGKGFAGRIAAQREPVILDQVDHTNVLNPILREKGITSLLGVPLLVEGRVIGVLHVGSLERRSFDLSDTELLQMVGDRIALAIHARQSEEHRAAADALQRSVLPGALPAIEGLEIANRYAPGEGGVGGDWYDVFALPSGDVALVIGDVAGRGLNAGVIMARARSVLRAYTLIGQEPVDVLGKLHDALLYFEPDTYLTVFMGVLSVDSGVMHYSSAGHLMPVLASPGGHVYSLQGDPDMGLGIAEPSDRHSYAVDIPKGGTLYLFTDGLVERRDRTLDEGLEVLRGSAKSGDPEQGCISILGATVGGRTLEDDFSLLGIHLIDLPR
jgi:putative methionine-R-sulfoxide reductase with GAF domain